MQPPPRPSDREEGSRAPSTPTPVVPIDSSYGFAPGQSGRRRQLQEVMAAWPKVGVVVRIAPELGMPVDVEPGQLVGEHAAHPGAALEVVPHGPRRPHDAVARGSK